MSNIKTVKASDVPVQEAAQPVPVSGAALGGPSTSPAVDPLKVEKLQKEFDAANDAAANSAFTIEVPKGTPEYIHDVILGTTKWKGLEAYAIVKASDEMKEVVDAAKPVEGNDAAVSITMKHELLEVVFHFMKSFESQGRDNAYHFNRAAEALVKPMNDLNALRQRVRDAAVNLEAARHGMTPEEFIARLKQQQQG